MLLNALRIGNLLKTNIDYQYIKMFEKIIKTFSTFVLMDVFIGIDPDVDKDIELDHILPMT